MKKHHNCRAVDRTKQVQMAPEILDTKDNQQLKIQTITNNSVSAKTQSIHCQQYSLQSFLLRLPSPHSCSSPQPCMLDASVSATPVIPLILNRLASATEENPQSGRLLDARSAETPINRQHMVIGYEMDYGPYIVCGRLPGPMVTWQHSGTHSLMRSQN